MQMHTALSSHLVVPAFACGRAALARPAHSKKQRRVLAGSSRLDGSDSHFPGLDFGKADWPSLPNLNSWLARPQGLIFEAIVAGVMFTLGFPIFVWVGGFAAMAFLITMLAVSSVVAVFTVLSLALPLLLGVGAVTTFFGWRFLKSDDGQKLRSEYERIRKQVAPGAPPVNDVLEMERDPEVDNAYRVLDEELSDFDRRLRGEKTRR